MVGDSDRQPVTRRIEDKRPRRKKKPEQRSRSTAHNISKGEMIAQIANATGLSKQDVVGVFEQLQAIVVSELNNDSGVFCIPGLVEFMRLRGPHGAGVKTKALPALLGQLNQQR